MPYTHLVSSSITQNIRNQGEGGSGIGAWAVKNSMIFPAAPRGDLPGDLYSDGAEILSLVSEKNFSTSQYEAELEFIRKRFNIYVSTRIRRRQTCSMGCGGVRHTQA